MIRVGIEPELLRWACERAGTDTNEIALRIPQLLAWESGKAQPTLRQIENFARVTHTPVGYLFLKEPPVERVPIPDYRTLADEYIEHPSPDLLDSIYICQQRQEWYRDYAREMGEDQLPFVGSADLKNDVEEAAARIRHMLGFDLDERRQMPTWTDALRRFIEQADELGVLVMVNGVVGLNNHRKLDPEEFRGFALSDKLAPLVFINGADTKAAQMFTLAHELAHIWIDQSALSDAGPMASPPHNVENWCNRVAAEILVPLSGLRGEYRKSGEFLLEVNRLARCFKVSTLVILRRINDAGYLTQEQFWKAYREELERLRAIPKGSGGNFYLTQAARGSKRFARALVASTLEGQTSFTEAFRMLGLKKMTTFHELGHNLGVM